MLHLPSADSLLGLLYGFILILLILGINSHLEKIKFIESTKKYTIPFGLILVVNFLTAFGIPFAIALILSVILAYFVKPYLSK